MDQILIVGASGTVGKEIVKNLVNRGQRVVQTTSKKHLNPGQVHLNLVNQEGLEKAFENIDRVFLLSPPGYTNQDELMGPVIDMAKKKGVKKIVFMSAMGANATDDAPLRKAERRVENSGLQYNIIRPNWFMQNFNSYWIHGINNDGAISLPLSNAKGSFVDARDIAAVASELLLSDKFDNQDFDLTGSEVLNHDQIAEILSLVSGRNIVYRENTPEVMLNELTNAGVPKGYAEFMVMILAFFKEGYSERTTDAVEKITAKKPTTFKQYAQDYKASWIK